MHSSADSIQSWGAGTRTGGKMEVSARGDLPQITCQVQRLNLLLTDQDVSLSHWLMENSPLGEILE